MPEELKVPELDTLLAKWPHPDALKPLAQKTLNTILAEHPPVERPQIVHLCGIPGSGKSTYAKRLKETHPDHYVLAFDQIMSQLPGYKLDCTRLGLKQAFANWELPARGLGYYFLQELLRGKRSIIFDHSAANESHVNLLKQIKALPYRVELHYLFCKMETARLRSKERERTTQRHTPEHYITERAALIDSLLPMYREFVDLYLEVPSD